MKRKFIFIFIGIIYATGAFAQTTIRSGSEVKMIGLVSTKGSITNNSDKTDVSEAARRKAAQNC